MKEYNSIMAALAEIVGVDHLTLVGLEMPVAVRLASPATNEQLMVFSRNNRPYRIERNKNGELEIMSPAGSEGSIWEALVISELTFWARENGGASFSSNGGFTLPDGSMRSPDAAWISSTRWADLSKAERSGYAPLCPDFVIEILSASDSRVVLEAKMQMWMTNGAQLAWMIDPYAATISIYGPNLEVEILDRPDSVEAGEPVAGFRLSTVLLWDE